MREIAQRAHVSIGTVSRVLNRHEDVDDELRERVETVARKIGYQMSARTRAVIQNKAGIIGLILLNDQGLNSAQSLLLVGVEEHCATAGYYLLFARHQHAEAAAAASVELPSVVQIPGLADCVILAGAVHANMLHAFERNGFEYVLLRNHLCGEDTAVRRGHFVEYDDAGGFYRAAQYLAQLGHKDIWYIGDASRPWDRNRLKGYLRAMAELNLEPHVHTIALSDDEFENGLAAVSFIFEQGWPLTAILAASDQIAFGAREGMRQHRREIPRDVSLIGFEHEPGVGRASNLTSVAVDMVEVGRQLARAAIAQIEKKEKQASDVVVPASLVKRSTCRPLREEEHMML
jgi:DNA-binding LacI/PurR family transcriptional regulator